MALYLTFAISTDLPFSITPKHSNHRIYRTFRSFGHEIGQLTLKNRHILLSFLWCPGIDPSLVYVSESGRGASECWLGLGHRFGHVRARSQAPPGTSSLASSACRVSVQRTKTASLTRPGRQSLQAVRAQAEPGCEEDGRHDDQGLLAQRFEESGK